MQIRSSTRRTKARPEKKLDYRRVNIIYKLNKSPCPWFGCLFVSSEVDLWNISEAGKHFGKMKADFKISFIARQDGTGL